MPLQDLATSQEIIFERDNRKLIVYVPQNKVTTIFQYTVMTPEYFDGLRVAIPMSTDVDKMHCIWNDILKRNFKMENALWMIEDLMASRRGGTGLPDRTYVLEYSLHRRAPEIQVQWF